jgi:hypothetical protein
MEKALVERPVKELIRSYLSLFRKKNLLEICEQLRVSRKKIPTAYLSFTELLSLAERETELSEFLIPESLLVLPKQTENLRFETEAGWILIWLSLSSASQPWQEELFQRFQNSEIREIKTQIGKLMSSVHPYFAELKNQYPELLDSVSLEIDPSNVTVRISDQNFPNYEHPVRIGFRLELAPTS